MIDFLPCPFCGCDLDIDFEWCYGDDEEGNEVLACCCESCDCHGPMMPTQGEAIAAWNERNVEE